MSRPRKPQTSADVEFEIRRLMEARQRLVAEEDQRRGALVREYLERPESDALRAALARVVGTRDALLFGLDGERPRRVATPSRNARPRDDTPAASTPA